VPRDEDLKGLDQLIAELGGSADAGKQSGGPCGLLLEHLRSARSSFLGSMPGEYRSSLKEDKASVACIAGKHAQAAIRNRLQNLIGVG
jgi:hypothetical protein